MGTTVAERRIYWDSCCFLGLINSEANKHASCEAVWKEVVAGRTELHTSMLTRVEVFKAKCEGPAKPLSDELDGRVEGFMAQQLVNYAVLDERTAIFAKTLMRGHPTCKKPTDAIHLATAFYLNVDVMHTYDGSDLIGLSGKLRLQNGGPLIIAEAAPIPPPSAPLLEWENKQQQ